jgi:hypothetical protein
MASDASAATVTIDRADDSRLRVRFAGQLLTSEDPACSADPLATDTLECTTASSEKVTLMLGAGADTVDARGATGIALTVDAGCGTDTLRLGSSGTTTVIDSTAKDVIDLSAADSSIRVRYEKSKARVVARCTGCSTPWAVILPRAPGRVRLGGSADDIDLGAWPTRGVTTWQLGAGHDEFWGAPIHRSTVTGDAGNDKLISRGSAVDNFRGGVGMDKLLDLGGNGDVLRGDAGTDSISSLDGKRDTVDGGAAADICLSTSRLARGCDTRPGGVRNVEEPVYFPVHTLKLVKLVLGIS